MKLSTKGRYATRAMLDLSLNRGEGLVLLKDIAKRQGISLSYLEHLITPLIAGGLIRSTRGAKGGITLTRPPEEIKLSEVIQLLEGSLAPVECVDNPDVCPRSELCATRDVWSELNRAVNGVLDSKTLKDLIDRQKEKGQTAEAMYHI